jgi:hypothetical protein
MEGVTDLTREGGSSLVQDYAQKRSVDLKSAVVLDEAQFPEFVHEKIHAGTRGANHLRQHFLRYFGEHALGFIFLAIAREQQQRASQAFFTGVKQLIDQVLFDADISGKHERDEPVGKFMFGVQNANHFCFFDNQSGGRRNRGCRSHANRLARQASFAKEIAGSQNRNDGFFTGFVDDRKPHRAFLDIDDIRAGLALREDRLFLRILDNLLSHTSRIKKSLRFERSLGIRPT